MLISDSSSFKRLHNLFPLKLHMNVKNSESIEQRYHYNSEESTILDRDVIIARILGRSRDETDERAAMILTALNKWENSCKGVATIALIAGGFSPGSATPQGTSEG
jgi:hypothetical protein